MEVMRKGKTLGSLPRSLLKAKKPASQSKNPATAMHSSAKTLRPNPDYPQQDTTKKHKYSSCAVLRCTVAEH